MKVWWKVTAAFALCIASTTAFSSSINGSFEGVITAGYTYAGPGVPGIDTKGESVGGTFSVDFTDTGPFTNLSGTADLGFGPTTVTADIANNPTAQELSLRYDFEPYDEFTLNLFAQYGDLYYESDSGTQPNPLQVSGSGVFRSHFEYYYFDITEASIDPRSDPVPNAPLYTPLPPTGLALLTGVGALAGLGAMKRRSRKIFES